MEKVNVEEKIYNFKLRKEDKDKLAFLNNCLEKAKKGKSNYNITITIDDMPRIDIDRRVNCITKILKEYGINKTVTIETARGASRCKNSIALIDFDSSDISWFVRHRDDEIIEIIKRCLANNNILIMLSTTSLNNYESIKEANVLKYLPRIDFTNSTDYVIEYRRLINKFKRNKINYSLSLGEFLDIYLLIITDDFIQNYRVSDYLYDYCTKNYSNSKNDIINKDAFKKLLDEQEETIEEKEKEETKVNIYDLIGLDNVKNELNQLFNYVKFLKEHDINREGTYLNMFFLGNPGTGKTMIANIIADKLYELGFVKKREVVKVIPTDLIGEYVGQTRSKIRKILNDARGKILFIDEAYLLYNNHYGSGNNPYMEEAIIELLKYLEDVNNITIFAGYENEMKKIYEANPGIKSRIYKEIYFEDYSVDELYYILLGDLKKKGFGIKSINSVFIKNYIKKIKNDKSFGNARSMKQLAQKLIINHASNFANGKTMEEMTITSIDVPEENKNMKREMGFGE